MQNAGAIFLGNTPGPARAYLGGLLAALRRRYRRLVIPCCGKFAIAEVAVNVGWSPGAHAAVQRGRRSYALPVIDDEPADALARLQATARRYGPFSGGVYLEARL